MTSPLSLRRGLPLAAGLALLALSACSNPGAAVTGGSNTRTATLARGMLIASVTATGNIQAESETRLGFLQSGTVSTVTVKVGDVVKKGDVLARLDTTDFEIALAQSQASLAQAQAGLMNANAAYSRTVEGPRAIDIQAAEAAYAAALANYDKVAKGPQPNDYAAAQAALDNADAALRQAQSAYDRAFSRDPAGCAYVGRPLPWEPLDDRAAIPSKVSTCLLAGLPVIADVRPGFYRYDELVRLGVNVDLAGYDDLRARLEREVATRERSGNALRERAGYSFDASIDALVATIGEARDRYFARPPRERARGPIGASRLVHLAPSPDPGTLVAGIVRRFVRPRFAPGTEPRGRLADLADLGREAGRKLIAARRARALAARFAPLAEPSPPAPARAPESREP